MYVLIIMGLMQYTYSIRLARLLVHLLVEYSVLWAPCCTIRARNYCVRVWSHSACRIHAYFFYCTFSSVPHQASKTSSKAWGRFLLVVLMFDQVQSPQTFIAKPEGKTYELRVPPCLGVFARRRFEAIPRVLPRISNSREGSTWRKAPWQPPPRPHLRNSA